MSVIWCARAWLVTPYRLRMVKNCQTLVLLSECRSANAAVRVPQCECRSASADQAGSSGSAAPEIAVATEPAFWAARGMSGSCVLFAAFSRCFEKNEILFDVAISRPTFACQRASNAD